MTHWAYARGSPDSTCDSDMMFVGCEYAVVCSCGDAWACLVSTVAKAYLYDCRTAKVHHIGRHAAPYSSSLQVDYSAMSIICLPLVHGQYALLWAGLPV